MMGSLRGNSHSSSLQRRNSIASLVPTQFDIPSNGTDKSFTTVDLELQPLGHVSYISLRDLLPSSPAGNQSPTTSVSSQSFHEITIRNRLVKHAAWAYLQPTVAASLDADDRSFFQQLCLRLMGFVRYTLRTLARAFDCILSSIWIE